MVSSAGGAMSGAMLTFARLRPHCKRTEDCRRLAYQVHRGDDHVEREKETLQLYIPDEHRSAVGNKDVARYNFTGVLEDDTTQEEVYQVTARDTVSASLRGFSGAIFAYGQTNSGKTWTITGGDGFGERGLAPRAIGQLFREIRDKEAEGLPVRYEVRASYLEVYEERVYDLLDISNRNKPVEEWATVSLLADDEGNRVLKGLTTYDVDNEEDTLKLFFMGNSHRVLGETPTNHASSRSHAVFTLAISSEREEEINGDGETDGSDDGNTRTIVSRADLSLVDLAGYERMYKNDQDGYSVGLDDNASLELMAGAADARSVVAAQHARKTAREREGKNINVSLHKLEKVMLALKNPGTHIPYRESALTSVLRRSLVARCRTVFVITLNLDVEDLPEAAASCRFAQSCHKVFCRPIADERLEPAQELRLLRKEAADTRASLMEKDDLLRLLAEELHDKEDDAEAIARQLEAVETAHAFHTTRSPTEDDRDACAVLAQALADGSDEAEEALEGLDRVSALQCCHELREILLRPPPPPPPPKIFADVAVSVDPEDDEFGDEEKDEEHESDNEAGQEVDRKEQHARGKGGDEQMKQLLAVTLSENADLLVELRYVRDQVKSLEVHKNAAEQEPGLTEGRSASNDSGPAALADTSLASADSPVTNAAATAYNDRELKGSRVGGPGGISGAVPSDTAIGIGGDPCARLLLRRDDRERFKAAAAALEAASQISGGVGLPRAECGGGAGNDLRDAATHDTVQSGSGNRHLVNEECTRRGSDRVRRMVQSSMDEYAGLPEAGGSFGSGDEPGVGDEYEDESDHETGQVVDEGEELEGDDHEVEAEESNGEGETEEDEEGGEGIEEPEGDEEGSGEGGDEDDQDMESQDDVDRCAETALRAVAANSSAGLFSNRSSVGGVSGFDGKNGASEYTPPVPYRVENRVDLDSAVRIPSIRPTDTGGQSSFPGSESSDAGDSGSSEVDSDDGSTYHSRDNTSSHRHRNRHARSDSEQNLSTQPTLDGNETPADATADPASNSNSVPSYGSTFDSTSGDDDDEGSSESESESESEFESEYEKREEDKFDEGDGEDGSLKGTIGREAVRTTGGVTAAVNSKLPPSRPMVGRNLGTRGLGGDRGGRPPNLVGLDTDGEGVNDPDVAPLLDATRRYVHYPTLGADRFDPTGGTFAGGDESHAVSGKGTEVAPSVEWQRALLTSGGFFIVHGRFGQSHMRFVWMSRDLSTVSWRCCGRRDVKGSVNTSSFDSVHLSGISYNTKDNPSTATSMAATVGTARAGTTGAFRAAGTSTSLAASWPRALLSLTGNAGNALKQIVLTGAGGRHRLVLELDAGNQEPEAELMKRDMWLEAFKYAVNAANLGVISRMLRSKKRPALQRSESKLPSTVQRRSSLSRTSSASFTAGAPMAITSTGAEISDGRPRTQTTPAAPSNSPNVSSPELRPHPAHTSSTPSPPLAPQPGRREKDAPRGNARRDASTRSTDVGGTVSKTTFVRPPAIDTSNLVGAMGPCSPSPRAHSVATPRVSAGKVDAGPAATSGDDGSRRRSKLVAKALAVEAAAVVDMGALTPTGLLTSPCSRGESMVASPPNTGGGGGDSKRGFVLPLREPIAAPTPHTDPLTATPGRSRPQAHGRGSRRSSYRSRDGEGAGVGVRDSGSVDRETSGVHRTDGKGVVDDGRDGSSSDGRDGSSSSESGGVDLSGARWARGKDLRGKNRPPGNGSGGGTGSGSSGSAGSRRASGKLLIKSRSSRRVSSLSAGRYIPEDVSPPPRGSGRNEYHTIGAAGDFTTSVRSTVRKSATTAATVASTTAMAASVPRERGGALVEPSPARNLARSTARRLSGLGAKAIANIGVGGGVGSSTGAESRKAPTGSPGARGDGPPPPPSREQRRRMSAALITEQMTEESMEPQPSSLSSQLPPSQPPPPESGARRRSVQQLSAWMANGAVGVIELATSIVPALPSSPRARDVSANAAGTASLDPTGTAAGNTTSHNIGHSPALAIGARRGVTMV